MTKNVYVNKQRNVFVTEKLQEIANNFSELFEGDCFIGDDMLISNCNVSFLQDDRFVDTLETVALADVYKQMAWRLHILDYFLNYAMKSNTRGAYVECGVFRGFKSFFLFLKNEELLKDCDKFLFDTFAGIDDNFSDGSPISPSEHKKDGLYEFVLRRFEKFSNTKIIKGSVPNSLLSLDISQVSFLHLDMNSWQAEVAALEFFMPKMAANSVIILDDFGLKSHRSQMEHEMPFFREKGYSILELPTGQGVVLI